MMTREQIEALVRDQGENTLRAWPNGKSSPPEIEVSVGDLAATALLAWTEDGRLWKDVAEEAAGQIAYLMEPSEAEKDRDELTVALATERARREACEAALSLAWDWINNEGVMDRIDRRAMEGGVVEAISAVLSPDKVWKRKG